MNTKDIEEWKNTHGYKQAVFAANRYLDEPCIDPDGDICTISRQFLRMIERYDTLTQHHEAEVEAKAIQVREEEANEYNKIIEVDVERAVEEERERIKTTIQESYITDDQYLSCTGSAVYVRAGGEYIKKNILQALTPTKTDKQYPGVPCAHGVSVNEDCDDCHKALEKLVFMSASEGLPTKTDKQV